MTRQVDCTYPYPSAARARATAHSALRREGGAQANQTRNLDGRLRHLEELIGNIVAQRASSQTSESGPSNVASGASSSSGRAAQVPQPPPVAISLDENSVTSEDIKPGSFISDSNQVTFVSGVHWAAICEEVSTHRHT